MKLFASCDTRYFLVRIAANRFQMRYRPSPFADFREIRVVRGTLRQAYAYLEEYVALKVITARLTK